MKHVLRARSILLSQVEALRFDTQMDSPIRGCVLLLHSHIEVDTVSYIKDHRSVKLKRKK